MAIRYIVRRRKGHCFRSDWDRCGKDLVGDAIAFSAGQMVCEGMPWSVKIGGGVDDSCIDLPDASAVIAISGVIANAIATATDAFDRRPW